MQLLVLVSCSGVSECLPLCRTGGKKVLLVGVRGAEGAALQSVLQRQGAAVLSCHWKSPQLQSEVSALLSAWAHPASPLSAHPCQLTILPFAVIPKSHRWRGGGW